ncbi:hypothetical protein SDC9_165881 [bioreactor metagenome]|uniref:Uncharacterized protein n=1 Tax=bioreactor metagenome TaxID=1076179 RepID=A0A645FVH5_9ZZZZ
MPVFVGCRGKRVEKPRAQAGFRLGGKSCDILRNLIRGDKSDAIHVLDDLIGIFFDPRKA